MTYYYTGDLYEEITEQQDYTKPNQDDLWASALLESLDDNWFD
jgi:hypothetical protein